MDAQEESQLRAALAAMSLRERLGGPCPVHLKAEELLSMAGRDCPERWAVVYLAVEEFDKIARFLGRQEFIPMFRIFYHDSKTGFTSVHLNPSRSHYALQYCIYRGMQKRMDSTFWRNQPTHEMQRVYKLWSYTAAQPDFSFLPHDLGIAKQHFPSFIMETSWELTLDELRAKVRWWFRATRGSVRVVLLVCVEPGPRGCIIIEKWSAARADSTLKELFIPTRKRLIRITPATPDYDSNGDPVATRSKLARVTGGPLEIKFDDVMLRERSLHLREPTRFVFRDQFFQKYATEVWTHAERRYSRQSTVT